MQWKGGCKTKPASGILSPMKFKGLFFMAAVLVCLATGCVTTKPISPAYLGSPNIMAVQVARISAKPQMEDNSAGAGGLAGAVASSINSSIERKRLAKRMGEVPVADVVELIINKVEGEISPIVPVGRDGNNLLMEIEVQQWGWRRNANLWLGSAFAPLSSTIVAKVSVFDLDKGKLKVAESTITGVEKVGRDPQQEDLKRGLELSAEDLAIQIRAFLQAKPASAKVVRLYDAARTFFAENRS